MEYVYEVYKEKSFTKAAQNLFVSQPSLSATVKRIEKKIGYPIFDRSTKPLGLTECGEKYIQAVEKMFSAENEFVDFVNNWGDLRTGSLILGGSNLFSSWILPQLMGCFTRKYPMVKLILVEESTAELEKLLLNGRVDLVIDNCLLDSAVFESCIYEEEHLLLAVPKAYEVNERLHAFQINREDIKNGSFLENDIPAVPLEIFQEEPFIVLKQENDTGKRAKEICHSHNFVPNILFELDQQQTAYNITCSGLGIAFISNTLIAKGSDNPNVVYYKLDGESSRRNLYFYWKKGRYFSRAMEEFLKIAKAGCAQDFRYSTGDI